jgi:Protein of unknown function (DUF1326)
MTYNIKGKFYEACDCEVICSCWAGVDPAMGQCTGLWAWDITTGVIGTQTINNSKVVIVSTGASCDDASHALILIDDGVGGASTIIQNAIFAAISSGPWSQVLTTIPSQTKRRAANISISATQVKAVALVAPSIIVEANYIFPPTANSVLHQSKAYLKDSHVTGLVSRAAGSVVDARVEVGQIVRDTTGLPPSNNGLNILADIDVVPPYTFDLDITGTTAMSGSFQYVL